MGGAPSDIAEGLIGNVIILLIVYFVLIFVFLIFPTYITHGAMVRERDNFLDDLSGRIDEAPEATNSPDKSGQHDVHQLMAWYLAVKQFYPVMPFTATQWRILRTIAALPPLVGILSGMFQLLTAFG